MAEGRRLLPSLGPMAEERRLLPSLGPMAEERSPLSSLDRVAGARLLSLNWDPTVEGQEAYCRIRH